MHIFICVKSTQNNIGLQMTIPKYEDLKGKVAVVTGGGGVLCSTLAEHLANQGAKVAVLDLNKEAAAQIVDRIVEKGGQAIGVKANVLQKESLELAHAEVNQKLGPCDILINGAGGNHPKGTTSKTHLYAEDIQADEDLMTFFKLDPEGIQFVFNLNFIGTLLPTQIFAKDMVNRDGCSILNVSSMNAYRPLTKIPAYSGAKAAVSNFTQWLAVHFAPVGIRVNALAPGFFLTEQNRTSIDGKQWEFNSKGTNHFGTHPYEPFWRT